MQTIEEMVIESQTTEAEENQRQDSPQVSLVSSTQEMANEVSKIDQKFFESLVAEIKKNVHQTREDVSKHNEMLQQLKTEVLKSTEDWRKERDTLKEEKDKLQRELDNFKENLSQI